MTNELKICERFKCKGASFNLETGESGPMQEFWSMWKPIDPQPDCETCQKQYTKEGMCPMFDVCGPLPFFCSKWEIRK